MEPRPNTGFVVADGSRAQLIVRHASGAYGVLDAWRWKSPRQHGDQPGRVFESVGHARHGLEAQDVREQEARRFAAVIARRVDLLAETDAVQNLVVVAPPRMLKALREQFSRGTMGKLRHEIAKDLTKADWPELRRRLEQAHRHLAATSEMSDLNL